MKNILHLVSIIGLSLIFSCKEELPIKNSEVALIDSTFVTSSLSNPQTKNILIEEYTGVRCINCPDGHKKVDEIIAKYGNRIIPVGVHFGPLAEPINSIDPDFRISNATELGNTFGMSTLPAAVIDRTKDATGISYGYNRLKWLEVVDNEVLKTSLVNVSPTSTYSSGKFIVTTNVEFTQAFSSATSVTLYIIENDIIATQKDGNIEIEDYEHKYVLRKVVTNTLGTSLVKPSSGYEKGRSFVKQYGITADSKWNVNNCYVVAFVTNDATNEVLQVSQVKLK